MVNYLNYYLQEESEEGEAEAQLNMQLAQENTHAKMARDSNFKVFTFDPDKFKKYLLS